MSEADQPRPVWERHLQTIFGAVAVALLLWNYTTVQKLEVAVAVQTQQIQVLTARLQDAQENRYSAADAARDFAERDRYLTRLELQLEKTEGRLDEHIKIGHKPSTQ